MIKKKLKCIVSNIYQNYLRLDKFLSIFFPQYSRSFFKKCIKNKQVIVNQTIVVQPKKKLLLEIKLQYYPLLKTHNYI
ncbi:S4 domain-containing protein [Buchnera aphidicola]|uniref:S4 domain-containing protein n=1 Tax=Buchnera aphidicola TaxID=9 RepID=UPI0034642F72